MLSGRRIVFKLKQFLKQFLGIFFTPKGISISSSLKHFSKQHSSISFTDKVTIINLRCFQL